MARGDWFRNTDWSDEIETAFFGKLRRARRKQQYLRIQASILARCQPAVALRLLNDYFALGDYFDHAQAHVDRASAYLTLGDTDSAVAACKAALAREQQHPRLLTEAWIRLPFLIASHGIQSHHDLALELLQQHRARLMFPADHFRWHAAHALIFSAQGQFALARQYALTAATQEHSGFRYHPTVGLVGTQYKDIYKQLSAIAST